MPMTAETTIFWTSTGGARPAIRPASWCRTTAWNARALLIAI